MESEKKIGSRRFALFRRCTVYIRHRLYSPQRNLVLGSQCKQTEAYRGYIPITQVKARIRVSLALCLLELCFCQGGQFRQ